MTLNNSQLKLFESCLSHYIQANDQFHKNLNGIFSEVIGLRTNLINSEYRRGIINEEEQAIEFEELDDEIENFDNRLYDWREERLILNQYLKLLQLEIRKAGCAYAA